MKFCLRVNETFTIINHKKNAPANRPTIKFCFFFSLFFINFWSFIATHKCHWLHYESKTQKECFILHVQLKLNVSFHSYYYKYVWTLDCKRWPDLKWNHNMGTNMLLLMNKKCCLQPPKEYVFIIIIRPYDRIWIELSLHWIGSGWNFVICLLCE